VADHQSLQMCSCLKTGALVNVTALFPISAMSGAQAENHAEAILSTFRLAPGTLDTRLEETTFASFQELQGGDPDLSWEMLDCVQGWNRTAQINGCNHAILRYPRVIAAGEWLLASDRLSDPEREEIQRAVHSSRTTLAVVHWVRAKLMHEEAPAQAREDCGAAERIVRDLDDADLIEELADCP
jgi:hypothetical protein